MIELRQTEEFSRWMHNLSDRKVRSRILARLDRVALGLLGDVKSLGGGILELRIDFGPGYGIYLKKVKNEVFLLLIGGDKSSQSDSIRKARRLSDNLKGENHG